MKHKLFTILVIYPAILFLIGINLYQIQVEPGSYNPKIKNSGDINFYKFLMLGREASAADKLTLEELEYYERAASGQATKNGEYKISPVPVEYDPFDYKSIKEHAEKGDLNAQYSLGLMFYRGQEVAQDVEKAAYWFTKAAEKGYIEAQRFLGLMYSIGKGVSKDEKQAAYWYTKVAEQGFPDDQFTLGLIYETGKGVPKDYSNAINWYTKAAQQGHVEAQYFLGERYLYGKGVPQDYNKGLYWYTEAARRGDLRAPCLLGTMYDMMLPKSLKDIKKAVYWYNIAAYQGIIHCQIILAGMYERGEGVPQNNKLAYVWFSLAASNNSGGEFIETAQRSRDFLAQNMTPQTLAEAQDLAFQIQYKIDHPELNREVASSKESVSREPETKGFGSGFIISKDGYILTCYHVVGNAQIIKVKIGENLHPAKLMYKDPNNDLALLKISGTFPAMTFSSDRTAKMGQEVFTIGYPNPVLQGVNEKLTNGSINSLTGFQDDIRLYQISVPVQPGNSGGPLLDMNGNVIGIVVAMLDASTAFKVSGSLPQNVNYAIKSTYAQALLDTLPEVSGNLMPAFKKENFDKVVDRVRKSVVMILVY